jgi:hypothetical protein
MYEKDREAVISALTAATLSSLMIVGALMTTLCA